MTFKMDEHALQGLGPHADSRSQQRAVQYFEQLKASEQGWQLCATALTSGAYHGNDHIKFFCFQVIEHYLKSRYCGATPAEQQTVKSLFRTWLQLQSVPGGKDKSFIRNKAAQIISLAFITDYPHKWPTFFSDLLQSMSLGETAVDMYLRVLQAIDTEVIDREIVHSPQEQQRNTMLKDAMRERDVVRLVDSWYQIITTYETNNPETVCLCLDVIGAYVSWIDINLIANDRFVSVLLRFMSLPLLRESTCDCIHEIISKGMDPVAKTKLIESFTAVLGNAGVMNVDEDEEGDYLAKLSKLINCIGVQLIGATQKLVRVGNPESTKETVTALENKIPLMLKFLGNEDDDVSGAVSQFAHDYLSLLKQMQPITDKQRDNVKGLLIVIIKKMKYDESYSFEQEGEDEAMFLEYRKQLKVIFNNLAALDAQLMLVTVHEIVANTLQSWQTADFRDVELAITLLYTLGEALTPIHEQHFSGDASRVTALQQMMRILVTCRVSCHKHCAVTLQFFETVVRYSKFFSIEPQHIPDVLMAFLDERGLRNQSVQVCSRVAYLFSRFIKSSVKSHLQNYIEDILRRVTDLLALHSPDNGLMHGLSSEDQLFMYETAGILIVSSQFQPEKKQELMKQLLAPIVTKFDGLLQHMLAERDDKRQQAYAECLNQAMGFASRTSKGFSNQHTMKLCGCVEAYTETLEVFLHALNAPVQRQLLNVGVRQFLHRMVVCLEKEILPFIPIAMGHLLRSADARELYDFIPLINQVICKFKKDIVPFLQEVFMPILTTIFQVLAAPVDENDQVAATEKKLLRRGYFSFIAALVNNDVTEVLRNQDMQNLHQVLITIIQGAVEIPDPQGQKACFAILRKLVEIWGGPDGLAGFDDFIYKSIIPACFMAPMKPTFDLNDGQTVLALSEDAMCLKTVMDKKGDDLIGYLHADYLPTINMSPDLIQEFCQALKSEPKVFKKYIKSFFTKAKS